PHGAPEVVAEPQHADPVPVAEPHPDPAPAAEEDDGEQLDEEPTEFPGGPKDTTVLALYGGHFARYEYESYHRLALTPVSHGRKLRQFDIEVLDEQWFRERLTMTGLADLAKTGY
ncbi:hypothetical protein A2U01_0021122, partial [Trifolium medium]|nr:hypothetical protein [Trifolium medium]